MLTENRWSVWYRGHRLTEVYFDRSMSSDDVKRALVNHDGYHKDIVVLCASQK